MVLMKFTSLNAVFLHFKDVTCKHCKFATRIYSSSNATFKLRFYVINQIYCSKLSVWGNRTKVSSPPRVPSPQNYTHVGAMHLLH